MIEDSTLVKSYSFHASLVQWAEEGSTVHFVISVSFIAAVGLIAMVAALGG